MAATYGPGHVQHRDRSSSSFADADYVLIPKFSTIGAWTEDAETKLYGSYLADHFRHLEETSC